MNTTTTMWSTSVDVTSALDQHPGYQKFEDMYVLRVGEVLRSKLRTRSQYRVTLPQFRSQFRNDIIRVINRSIESSTRERKAWFAGGNETEMIAYYLRQWSGMLDRNFKDYCVFSNIHLL
jgi:hypothetical protein